LLSIKELNRLQNIFAANNWSLTTRLFHPNNLNLFDAISAFISGLEQSDRELVYCLLEKYEIIVEYRPEAQSLIERFLADFDETRQYFLAPLIPPGGSKIKSGHTVLYEAISFIDSNKYANIMQVDTPFSEQIDFSKQSVVVFFDDFVGTGTQFDEMYEEFELKRACVPTDAMLLVIRIQQEAYAHLSSKGVRIISGDIRPKAISSGYAIGDLDVISAHALYKAIQDRVELQYGCNLGFGGAEALITMKKTPDNTLPIFWASRTITGGAWPAPFPRV
jgi:hypothetical protein